MKRFILPSLPKGEPTGLVPKRLHQVWVSTEVPRWARRYWADWAELHPDWEIFHWTDANSDQWPMSNSLRDRIEIPAVLADFIRLEKVYGLGGVYLDTDMRPMQNIDALTDRSAWVGTIHTVTNEQGFKINNAAFGFPERHPAVVDLWEAALGNFGYKDPRNVAGPRVWEKIIPRHEVEQLPREAFYDIPSAKRHSAAELSLEQLRLLYPESYAVHEGDHSWIPQAKRVHRDN